MDTTWQLEPAFKKAFLEACDAAAQRSMYFKNFRAHPKINTVIENTNEEWMRKAYMALHQADPVLLEYMGKFTSSDRYGSPPTYFLDGYIIAPTTVRYIYTLSLLRLLFKNLDGMDIVEIGGGYGGQCKIICDVYNPKSYTMYDLKEMQNLQSRFLSGFDIEARMANGIETFESDLVIAWCSWSELDLATRREYVEKVIVPSKRFFICCNYNWEEDYKLLQEYFGEFLVYDDSLVTRIIYKL